MKQNLVKKSCIILLVFILVFTSTSICFALEKNQGMDTLSYTPDQYLNKATATRITQQGMIEEICKSFIAMGRASVREEGYKPQKLIQRQAQNSKKNLYRLSEYEYLKELYKAENKTIIKDKLTFSGYKCEINGNTAKAEIVENYVYYFMGDSDYNLRYRKYIFNLEKDTDGWKIKHVCTDDPQEAEENFAYEPINVKKGVDNAKEVVQLNDKIISNNKNSIQPSASLYKWSYSVSTAKSYAVKYVNNPNTSIFGYNSGNNCQNFASQCVWAGLRGKYTDVTTRAQALERPAIKKTSSNSSAANIWAQNNYTSYYSDDDYNKNWTWDNVKGFAQLIETSSSYREGPFGNFLEGGLSYAKAGSVIYWSTSATNPGINKISHAMFVTEANASVGSITKSDIKIAANTKDTNGAYESLSSYCDYSANKFSACVIDCGYYNVSKSSAL